MDKFAAIKAQMGYLIEQESARGYFQHSTNIILLVSEKNVAWARELFWVLGFRVVVGQF